MQIYFSPALQEILKEAAISGEISSSHKLNNLPPLRISQKAGVVILGAVREPNIHAYAADLYISELSCAQMSWELSYNRLGYLNGTNFSDILGAVSRALGDANSLANALDAYASINWVICINFLIQFGDYEAMPEDIENLTAKSVIANEEGKWWFDYQLSFAQDRGCSQLPELNVSAGMWGKSLSPLRAVLFVRP